MTHSTYNVLHRFVSFLCHDNDNVNTFNSFFLSLVRNVEACTPPAGPFTAERILLPDSFLAETRIPFDSFFKEDDKEINSDCFKDQVASTMNVTTAKTLGTRMDLLLLLSHFWKRDEIPTNPEKIPSSVC